MIPWDYIATFGVGALVGAWVCALALAAKYEDELEELFEESLLLRKDYEALMEEVRAALKKRN